MTSGLTYPARFREVLGKTGVNGAPKWWQKKIAFYQNQIFFPEFHWMKSFDDMGTLNMITYKKRDSVYSIKLLEETPSTPRSQVRYKTQGCPI